MPFSRGNKISFSCFVKNRLTNLSLNITPHRWWPSAPRKNAIPCACQKRVRKEGSASGDHPPIPDPLDGHSSSPLGTIIRGLDSTFSWVLFFSTCVRMHLLVCSLFSTIYFLCISLSCIYHFSLTYTLHTLVYTFHVHFTHLRLTSLYIHILYKPLRISMLRLH